LLCSHLSDINAITAIIQAQTALMYKHGCPSVIRHQLQQHIISMLDQYLFNALLTYRELCTFGNAIHMKITMAHFEDWAKSYGKHIDGYVRKGFQYTRQAMSVLVMDKTSLLEEDARTDVCPNITLPQLFQLVSNFLPDEYVCQCSVLLI